MQGELTGESKCIHSKTALKKKKKKSHGLNTHRSVPREMLTAFGFIYNRLTPDR